MFIFRVVKFFCKEIDIVIIEINKFLIKGVIRKVIYVFGEFILIIFIRIEDRKYFCFNMKVNFMYFFVFLMVFLVYLEFLLNC